MKASDVFREAVPLFGKKVSFEEAFPTIRDLSIQVEEAGHGVYPESSKRTYAKVGEYINCSNPLCYNGGFSIGDILRDMVKKKQIDLETIKSCQGYEGSPKGERRYHSCINSFKVSVHIDYK